jgi:uncharacterized protein (TIGR02246 family)
MKEIKNGKIFSMDETSALSLEQRVQRLEDIEEIRDILHHYTRCVDRGDVAGIASCYTEDGCFYPSDTSAAPISGKAAIEAIFTKLLDPNVKTSEHYISNQQVHFISDTEALVFAYFYANKSFTNREDEITCGGYELRVVKESDNQWRMKSHKCFFTRQDGSRTGRHAENLSRQWPPVPEFLKQN